MKANRSTVILRIISFVLTAGLMAFAFIHSSMPAVISDEESTTVLGMFNLFGFEGLFDETSIRKLAHFAEFSAIGVALCFCAYSFNKKKPHRYWSQMLFAGLMTAVLDEAIQLNVEGRAGMITDVLLDFSGVLTGICLMLIIFAIYRRIRKI